MKITMITEQLLWKLDNEIAAMEVEAARKCLLGNGPAVPERLKKAYQERKLLQEQVNSSSTAITSDLFRSRALTSGRVEDKTMISIDRERGIYRNQDGKILAYPIKGKRRELLKLLWDNQIAEASKLRLLYETDQLISSSVKKINGQFIEKLELQDPIIIHLDAGGYKLNKDKYEIECKL